MRPSIPKLIAAASIFAAIPLSSAYAVHRHHRAQVDTMTTASVPADPEARAATQQLLAARFGHGDPALFACHENQLLAAADRRCRCGRRDGVTRGGQGGRWGISR